MRCIVCREFSLQIICNSCQKNLLSPNISQKDDVISFYRYEDIEFLLHYKYEKFGSRIFNILAKNSFKQFAKFYKEKSFIIPINDNFDKGYSHTAILARYLNSKYLKVLYQSLLAQNDISYAGKSLEFRKQNKRNFKYFGPENIEVILVDDIVTTKSTINEAKELLLKHNVKVNFSLVLADKRW